MLENNFAIEEIENVDALFSEWTLLGMEVVVLIGIAAC